MNRKLTLFGFDLEVIDNDRLKTMYQSLVDEDSSKTETHRELIEKEFPQFFRGAIKAMKEFDQLSLRPEKIVVKGKILTAITAADFGSQKSSEHPIAD